MCASWIIVSAMITDILTTEFNQVVEAIVEILHSSIHPSLASYPVSPYQGRLAEKQAKAD